MKIHHIAIWTFRLEELREFYIRYFNGTSNEKYINPKKGFESYFIYFDDGAALELMSRTDVQNTPIEENKLGLTHFALSFQSKEDVLRTTEQLRSDGYTIAGEPRTSGDGYFESVILDPNGNRVECVYRKEETSNEPVSYTHLRAHETGRNLVCRLLLEKKNILYTSPSLRDRQKYRMPSSS